MHFFHKFGRALPGQNNMHLQVGRMRAFQIVSDRLGPEMWILMRRENVPSHSTFAHAEMEKVDVAKDVDVLPPFRTRIKIVSQSESGY